MFRRMQPRENFEKCPVCRRRIRHARISQHHRKKRTGRDPQNHARGYACGCAAVNPLHKQADDELGLRRFLPRHHAQNAELHRQIQHRNSDNRNENAPRNRFFGFAHFSAQMAHVVVAQIRVHRLDRRRAQPGPERPAEIPRALRIRKRQTRIKMCDAAPDEPHDGGHHSHPDKNGNFSDRGNAPVEQNDQQNDQRAGNCFFLVRAQRHEIRQVLRKSDGRARHHQRRLNHRLPHKQKRHQPSPPLRPIRFLEERITSARQWQRRAELRPNAAVQQTEHRSRDPCEHRLRPRHQLNHQRRSYKRPNSHDVDHIQRSGFEQAEAAFELGGSGRGVHVMGGACRITKMAHPALPSDVARS